jgi:hypothetical protein
LLGATRQKSSSTSAPLLPLPLGPAGGAEGLAAPSPAPSAAAARLAAFTSARVLRFFLSAAAAAEWLAAEALGVVGVVGAAAGGMEAAAA